MTVFDTLESRCLLSAAVPTFAIAPYPATSDETFQFVTDSNGLPTTLDLARVAVIQIPGGDRTASSFSEMVVGGTTRKGGYTLPSIASDGTSHMVGSNQPDQITVEGTTGVPQTTDEHTGVDSNGGIILLNVISADTHRRVLPFQSVDKLKAMARAAHGAPQSHQDKTAEAMYDAAVDAAVDGSFIHYALVGVYDYYVQSNPTATASAKINIDAGAGSDTIRISTNVAMQVNLYGGSGADTLTSGKRKANLYGGGGSDLLTSRSLHGGMLDGGTGADRYANSAVSSAEIHVFARADGDVLLVPNAQPARVTSAGLFGVSTINGDDYYIIDDGDGEIVVLDKRP